MKIKSLGLLLCVAFGLKGAQTSVQSIETVIAPLDQLVMPKQALIEAYIKVISDYGQPLSNDENGEALVAVFAIEYEAFCNGQKIVSSLDDLTERLRALKEEHGSWEITVLSCEQLSDDCCYKTTIKWTLFEKKPLLIEARIYSQTGHKIDRIVETITPME